MPDIFIPQTNHNSMKSWQKGGLIGLGIALVIDVIVILLFKGNYELAELLLYIPYFVGFPWTYILGEIIIASQGFMGDLGLEYIFASFFGLLINSFIIGALIGKFKKQLYRFLPWT